MLTKNRVLQSIVISLFTILIGLAIGSIIIVITSGPAGVTNFFEAIYKATLDGLSSGSMKKFGTWLYTAVPLILCGLSVAFAYRVGLFNIGAEGQFIVASFTAVVVGYYLHFPGSWIIVIIIATFAAMLYAFIPGFLKAYYGISEVVVTIMLNWIALMYVNRYLIQDIFHFQDNIQRTPNVSETSSLKSEFFNALTDGSLFNIGFFIAIIACLAYWYTMSKTTFGYELKAVGYAPDAAKYAGIKSKKSIIYSMMISGMFAGLAGAIMTLSENEMVVTTSFRNFGFDGIAVAMLGQLSSFGIFFSGLLFSALRLSESYMTSIPPEIIDIIVAVIIVSSAFTVIIRKKINKGGKKNA